MSTNARTTAEARMIERSVSASEMAARERFIAQIIPSRDDGSPTQYDRTIGRLSGSLPRFQPPRSVEHARFLISFLFGGEMDPGLRHCILRAYLDLSRTLHGLAKHPEKAKVLIGAQALLLDELDALLDQTSKQAVSFDPVHEELCSRLCTHFERSGYDAFSIGQAQKWINMAVKYALALDAVGTRKYANAAWVRTVAHVPIDNYIVAALEPYGAPRLPRRWSRLTEYPDYLAYQHWIRTRFAASVPLDVEFYLWNEEAARLRKASVDPISAAQSPGDDSLEQAL